MSGNQLDDSDTDDGVEDFYFPRKQNTRANAVKRLQAQRENLYLDCMLSSLKTVMRIEETPVESQTLAPKSLFNPSKLSMERIQSWRDERKLLKSSINDYTQQKRFHHQSQIPGENIGNYRRQSISTNPKFRPEPTSLKLDKFLNSIHCQLEDAVLEVRKGSQQKYEVTNEDILRRPSQLVKLAEADAGTDKDELRSATQRVLKKLSKQCSYWINKKNDAFVEHDQIIKPNLREVQ